MRPDLVALIVLVAGVGAGCVQNSEAPVTSLEIADASGLRASDQVFGLREAEGTWTWDVLDGMEPDTIRLLAIQALETGRFEHHAESTLAYASGPGESPSVDSVCLLGLAWRDAPGDYYLQRSLGQPIPYTPRPFSGGAVASRGGGGGSGTTTMSGEGEVEKGNWTLYAFGLAGYDPGLAQEDGDWTLEFGFGGRPLRIVELEPAPFSCGVGFSSLPGASTTPGIDRTVGGELAMSAMYGGYFAFCPGFGLPPEALTGPDSAHIEFMGNRTQLSNLAPEELADHSMGSMALRNEEWTGRPLWTMRGFVMPDGAPSGDC